MPRKKSSVFNVKESEPFVDVVIKKSNLDGESYASVVPKKVDMISLMKATVENSKMNIDFPLVYSVVSTLSEQMMSAFENGYSVDMLGFGELKAEMKGRVDANDTPLMLKKHLEPVFKPSAKAKKAIEKLQVRSVRRVSPQHIIYYVSDFRRKEMRNCLVNPQAICIAGKGIKLDKVDKFLYAAKVAGGFNAQRDKLPQREEGKELFVVDDTLSRIVAEVRNLEAGKYVLVLHTPYSAGGKLLKTPVEVVSDVFEIKREGAIEEYFIK